MNKVTRRFTGNPAKASFIKRDVTGDPSRAVKHLKFGQTRAERAQEGQGEFLCRTMPRAGDLDEESREFRAIVATNTPVPRRDAKGFFLEVLDPAGLEHKPGRDYPLLTDHRQSARETVGRAYRLKVDGPSISATLRLAVADDVEPLLQRVRDGVIRHVSAGYTVLQWAESRNPDGIRVKTATRWRLLEVSLVPVPADENAIIKRGAEMPFDTVEDRDSFVEEIRSLVGLSEEWADGLPEDADEDAIRAAAREALTQRSAPKIRITRSHDDPAQIQTRAADALAFRMGGLAELPEASREFAHMSLMDHARDALARGGISTRGMSADEVLSRSLTTSDFPLTVANAANKTAADGYKAAESALKPLFRQRSLSDFKTATSVRLGGMGVLAEMTESGEFTAVSRGEEGETLQLRTFGRRLDLSRRLIINDDLALFGDTTRALGEAAAQTEAALMADLLTGSDPLSDGTALFHASRGNIVDVSDATGDLAAQPLLWALSQARLTMRQQKNLDGITPIAATPRYIVAGPEMETTLEQLLTPVNNVAQGDANVFVGKLSLLIDPRIEGDDFYIMADPAQAHVFNIAHLAAAPGPQIQRQEAWDTLGVSFRCWMDCGVGFAGWRGAVKVVHG